MITRFISSRFFANFTATGILTSILLSSLPAVAIMPPYKRICEGGLGSLDGKEFFNVRTMIGTFAGKPLQMNEAELIDSRLEYIMAVVGKRSTSPADYIWFKNEFKYVEQNLKPQSLEGALLLVTIRMTVKINGHLLDLEDAQFFEDTLLGIAGEKNEPVFPEIFNKFKKDLDFVTTHLQPEFTRQAIYLAEIIHLHPNLSNEHIGNIKNAIEYFSKSQLQNGKTITFENSYERAKLYGNLFYYSLQVNLDYEVVEQKLLSLHRRLRKVLSAKALNVMFRNYPEITEESIGSDLAFVTDEYLSAEIALKAHAVNIN